MTDLLISGHRDSAIKILRERTDVGLAGSYHLVTELSTRIDPH